MTKLATKLEKKSGEKLSSKSSAPNDLTLEKIIESNWDFSAQLQRLATILGNQPTTALIGLLAAISVLNSVVFEVGYLISIDHHLISFFTVQDALSSSIHAVPILAVLFVFLVMIIEVFTGDYVTRVISEAPKRSAREQYWVSKFWQSVLILAILHLPFATYRLTAIYLIIFLTFLVLSFPISAKKHLKEAAIAWWILCFTLMVFPFAVFGEIQAIDDLSSTRRDYRITVDNKSFDVLLLKANADVLIVRDDPRSVRVIPRRSVGEIKILDTGKRRPWLTWAAIWDYFFPVDKIEGYRGR